MLEELTIHDFALIDRVHVKFGDGFNVLSGETGAGKSILIGAIGFLLGGKADSSCIRAGTDETSVSCVLSVSGNEEAEQWLSDHGIPTEEGGVILRRSLKSNGRGSIHINATPVVRQDLVVFSGMLVDMHGQHDHGALLEGENHRKLLDRFAGIESEVKIFSQKFADLTMKRRTFEKMAASERERAREIELLEFSIDEIAHAKLKLNEDEELKTEEKRLSQHEKLFAGLETAHSSLHDASGVLASLRKARAGLEQAQTVDEMLSPFAHRLDDAYYEIEDITDSLRHYVDSVKYSPERLEEVEERLAMIRKLEKKYGDSIQEITLFGEKCSAELEALKNWDEDRSALSTAIADLEKEVYAGALAISGKRLEAAKRIDIDITSILRTLGMPKASFSTSLTRKEPDGGKAVVGQFGLDVVEFLIAPNQGEGMKPLSKIASGGELSRVMLAIKTVLSKSDTVETMIFDEIDTGIGGEIANTVAVHLDKIAERKQVFCITHLAVIAAHADNHMVVTKRQEGARTITSLEAVTGRSRVEEVARMLSGSQGGTASLLHAEELLKSGG